MRTIALDEEWVQTVQLFGDVESVIKKALKAYSVDQCQQRIGQSEAKIAEYAHKYQCTYEHFTHTIQTDEAFLERIQAQYPLWEEDVMEWKYWVEEQQAWQHRLKAILQR